MITSARRISAIAVMAAAPALIAFGAATAHADTVVPNPGPSVSHSVFPNQTNFPQPGTAAHHHHQWNR